MLGSRERQALSSVPFRRLFLMFNIPGFPRLLRSIIFQIAGVRIKVEKTLMVDCTFPLGLRFVSFYIVVGGKCTPKITLALATPHYNQ